MERDIIEFLAVEMRKLGIVIYNLALGGNFAYQCVPLLVDLDSIVVCA